MPRKKGTAETPKRPMRPPRMDTDEVFEAIQADLGGYGVVIQRGADLEGRFDLRRPCGIPSLDIGTGGGLPAGGMSQIDGPDGTGKNLLIYHYFAQCQKLHGDSTNIFMSCMEFPFDKAFAFRCGFKVPFSDYEVEVERRRRKDSGEGDITEEELEQMVNPPNCGKFHVLRGPAEAQLDAIVRLVETNSYQLGAIDSWDAMLTVAEDEAELADDPRIASASNVQTKWMRKMHSALAPRKRCPDCWAMELEHKKHAGGNYSYSCQCGWKGQHPFLEENETTIIGIRQARANLKGHTMRSREWKVGGAYALKHGKLVDIQLRPGEIIYTKDGKQKIGKEINWEITKGKAGTHEGKMGSFKYYFDPPQIDIASDFLGYCMANDIIQRAGAIYTLDHAGLLPDENPLKFKGMAEITEAISERSDLKTSLMKLMLRKANYGHIRHKDIT